MSNKLDLAPLINMLSDRYPSLTFEICELNDFVVCGNGLINNTAVFYHDNMASICIAPYHGNGVDSGGLYFTAFETNNPDRYDEFLSVLDSRMDDLVVNMENFYNNTLVRYRLENPF